MDRIRGHDRKSTKKRESSEKLILVPEEELQRRNWSRLLVNKAENRSPQQTYRISIPDDVVALRTPPPLTAPLQSLGLSGTLKGPSSPYEGQIMSQNISNNALPSEDQCVFHQPFVVEAPISTQIATLEAARERARIAQARPNPPSPRNDDDTLPWPPVIVNTRNQYGENISQIPLSERHPLERVGHITGIASKDRKNIYSTSGVYRADEDYGGHDYDEEADANDYFDKPTFEIVKGQDIQVDLTKDYARQQPTILRSPNLLHNSPQQIHIQRLTSISPRQELHRKARESR